jgi:hypothetical protein
LRSKQNYSPSGRQKADSASVSVSSQISTQRGQADGATFDTHRLRSMIAALRMFIGVETRANFRRSDANFTIEFAQSSKPIGLEGLGSLIILFVKKFHDTYNSQTITRRS